MFPEVVLVTGGTRGIGRAITLKFLQGGAKVIAIYRSDEEGKRELETLAEKLKKPEESGDLWIIKGDISQSSEVKNIVSEVQARYPRVDVLVNNAGITRDGLFLRMKEEDFLEVIQSNFLGTYHLTREILPLMVKVRWGRIINLASVVGMMGNAGQTNYAASKAAIIGFTRSLARELAPLGITVNALAPGYIETELTANLSEEIKTEYFKKIPLRRFGRPEEVAELVYYLASKECSYITGQVLVIDGGLTS